MPWIFCNQDRVRDQEVRQMRWPSDLDGRSFWRTVLNRALSPQLLRPEDAEPHWRWNRAIPAPGHSNVDFEGRVDFDRLRRYRLQRAREALEKSECGALLLFDVNN